MDGYEAYDIRHTTGRFVSNDVPEIIFVLIGSQILSLRPTAVPFAASLRAFRAIQPDLDGESLNH